MDNQRNLILSVLLIGLVLFGWDAAVRYFYPQSDTPTERIEQVEKSEAGDAPKASREGGLSAPADVAAERKTLAEALADGGRVPVDAPGLSGSINLTGAVVDDLVINDHRESQDRDSGPVRIFSPSGTPAQHFAQFGWVGTQADTPDADTVWQVAEGERLTPGSPVTLRWQNGSGQVFSIKFSIDEDYMITAQQTVANGGGEAVTVKPFALINRTERTASLDSFNVHSGPLGTYDDAVEFGTDYDDVAEADVVTNPGRTDWVGFTDVYWMSSLIPGDARATSDFRSLGSSLFRADLLYGNVSVPSGKQFTRITRLFAGAKESAVLDQYEDGGISRFGMSIDWGWFFWFEKPIFWLLRSLFHLVGNFGVAIILLTVIVRGVMFPIAQRGFASMAAMRAVQPKMKAIQERYKDDKQKQQQEIMALYKKEGVNPLSGCLPMLLQIPVFFALYKVLILSIEMRHQPFALWIKDLSAPDPLLILNLFGLLPFTPPSFLAIGLLAVLLGVTMWLQFRLNPAPMDPVQQQMFAIMPWVMMFIMAPFAAGLLVYWITSNILTIAQQKYLYSKHPQLREQAQRDAEEREQAREREKAAKAAK
ncbi:membrane protein insertase YidC [Novosphingobium marinum]|uniref:Membrane protein insertase YidC n=1 Tax=Novosphingobium marinum TaxID=1514948 RepID=A0A7Y9XV22_9SPHN|nr:membrane protein insertase YidC [Novosphingobium marinum]NYH95052.1 YidC/Oxa1 family membrane protein insertase [Novosphingobium marinum]GGC23915.1 membrane protein insertase YidC [Novosphingobium marinum]